MKKCKGPSWGSEIDYEIANLFIIAAWKFSDTPESPKRHPEPKRKRNIEHVKIQKRPKVNFVCAHFLHLILILLCLRSIQHSYSSLGEIVGHCKLRIPVEANVVLVLADLLVVDAIDVVLGSSIVALSSSSSIAFSM